MLDLNVFLSPSDLFSGTDVPFPWQMVSNKKFFFFFPLPILCYLCCSFLGRAGLWILPAFLLSLGLNLQIACHNFMYVFLDLQKGGKNCMVGVVCFPLFHVHVAHK